MFIPTLKSCAAAACLGALCLAVATSVGISAQQNGDPKDDRGRLPDACEQSLQPPGHARGLHARCANGGSSGAARGDFNADGIADLAVGAPYEDQDGIRAVGGVHIFYGTATGLSSTGDLFLDETHFGFSYATDDFFGWALASGDFNGDTYSDLAIGMPGRDSGTIQAAGRVLLINGSVSGLNLATVRTLQLLPSGRGSAGEALVWADFNGDGFGDLAVGVPRAEVTYRAVVYLCAELTEAAGEVEVFYGGATGLSATGAQRIYQNYTDPYRICAGNGGVGNLQADGGDRFGAVLAAGNFNGDVTRSGRPIFDLVIATPADDLVPAAEFPDDNNEVLGAGAVQVLRGSTTGVSLSNVQELSQRTAGIGGGPERDDQFGRSLAVGDFNADLHDDLAIGVPFEDLTDNSQADAGAVHMLYGSFTAGELVTTVDSEFISQADLPASGVEAGDRFGWALTTGRFNSDFVDDLAIGVPGEDIGAVADAGVVHVIYNSTGGPLLGTAQQWRQGGSGLPEVAEAGDQFGYAVSAWNYGRDDRSDLAIGAPFEDLPSGGITQTDAGAVVVIYGTAAGLTATTANPAQLWHQDVSGVNDVLQQGDRFGYSLY